MTPADSSNDSLLTTADHQRFHINKLTHWEGKPLPCQSLLHITHHKRQCRDPPAASPATTNVLNLAKIEEAMTCHDISKLQHLCQNPRHQPCIKLLPEKEMAPEQDDMTWKSVSSAFRRDSGLETASTGNNIADDKHGEAD